MIFLIPIIIQTDFSDRLDLFFIKKTFHPCKLSFIKISDFVGMNADRPVHKRILFCQFYDLIP